MARRLSVLAGIIVSGILLVGCDNGSTPATPTTPTPVAPTPPPPPPPPPAEPPALASVELNPDRVTSQGNPEGRVTLTAPATANAVVNLSSGNPAVARVPDSVTIAAGSTSNTFRVETSTVNVASPVTIVATFAGVTKTASLTVLAPALEPRFTVKGAKGDDTCDIINSSGATDCEFNASTSSGFVARYLWTMKVGNSEVTFTTGDSQATVVPTTNCGLLGNGTSQDGKIQMEVSLQLEDRAGDKSGTVRRTVTIHHNNRCGY